MAKSASNIVDRALTLIDEAVVSIADAATTETSMKDIALEVLPEVCRDLVKELPYELKRHLATPGALVEEVLLDGEVQTDYIKQKVAFTAPSDFWELSSIKLSAWSKVLTDYILIGSPEYQVQNNPFTRGGKQNPVVALTNKASGSDARIECFSVGSGDSKTVAVFEYISFNNVPDDIGTNWPDELFDEITKALASQLNIIKSRLEEGALRNEETLTAITQHK